MSIGADLLTMIDCEAYLTPKKKPAGVAASGGGRDDEALKSVVAAIRAQLRRFEDTAEQNRHLIADLRAKSSNLGLQMRAGNDVTTENLAVAERARLELKIAELQKLVDQLQSQPKTAVSPSHGLHLELREAQERAHNAEARAVSAEGKVVKLQAELGEMCKEARKQRAMEPAPTNDDVAAQVIMLERALEREQQLSQQLRHELMQAKRDALKGQEDRVAGAGKPLMTADTGANHQAELERLREDVSRLSATLVRKDKMISELTVRLSDVNSQQDLTTELDANLSSLTKKQDKLDADMELMEENLTLQAALAAKERELTDLRLTLKKRQSLHEIIF